MKLSAPLSLIFIKLLSLVNAETQECWVHPDPHFKTWDGTYYDYHGGCDLVLVKNPTLELHIRTVPVPGYSFIQASVLRIGSDTLEIDTSSGSITVLKNGNPFTLPGNIHTSTVTANTTYGSTTYEVLLNNGASIRFLVYLNGLSVVVWGEPTTFANSEGMCGKWGTPGLIDRSSATAVDGNAMGVSWQVQSSFDTLLFQTPDTSMCQPPIGQGGACVNRGEINICDQEACNGNCVEEGDAEDACQDIPNENERNNCIYDVETTGNPDDWKDAPFYNPNPPGPPVDDRCTGLTSCQQHHDDAICVYNCVEDSNFECLPALCSESTSTSGQDSCACKAPKSDPNINGDPHIVTWSGKKYDFHGVCDLVLLQNPDFQHGLGMDIHVRTKQMKEFSYVSSAVLRIGDDTLEVVGNLHESLYWINKQVNANLDRGISGYPISYREVNSKQHEFIVNLGGKKSIILKTYKKFVRVNIQGATKKSFGTSLGLLGSYGSGKMVARDKSTILEDTNTFGQEWQVLPIEDMLFHNVEGPQSPNKCHLPQESTLRRRLAESTISKAEAEIVCARVSQVDFDMCVFDVMATGDKDVVGAF